MPVDELTSLIVHKVTCFIIRQCEQGCELLLFQHPNAGIQITAGTANPNEEPEHAARREALEESGLQSLKLLRWLGDEPDPLPTGHVCIAYPTLVYARPDLNSFDWVHFPTGLMVEELRHVEDFTLVRYEEKDDYFNPQYATYSITGWVPIQALTEQRLRHFYLFETPSETPQRWSIVVDKHVFELFWAPISHLPGIIHPQDGWVKWIAGLM